MQAQLLCYWCQQTNTYLHNIPVLITFVTKAYQHSFFILDSILDLRACSRLISPHRLMLYFMLLVLCKHFLNNKR